MLQVHLSDKIKYAVLEVHLSDKIRYKKVVLHLNDLKIFPISPI
jgi:hypothetical protein